MFCDIVTVVHNDTNKALAKRMLGQLDLWEGPQPELEFTDEIEVVRKPRPRFTATVVDNSEFNRGFAGGCNFGALNARLYAPIIGFLNPDVCIDGPFIDIVRHVFMDDNVVITGERFRKPEAELRVWGVNDWVCGAAMFVRRDWFVARGGFDPQFVWGWEETDLIRQAQADGKICRSVRLPITHSSPDNNSAKDAEYKNKHFERGAVLFRRKWEKR